jgi:hypothetical protein
MVDLIGRSPPNLRPPSIRSRRRGAISPAALVLLAALAVGADPARAGVNVVTYHNDNARTGQNLEETILIPSFVISSGFGKLFSRAVDGYVYAQPLYLSDLEIPGKGSHNVVFVATEHDSVYAFDADSSSGANATAFWHRTFINSSAGITTVPNSDVGSGDIVPEIGITSTPVIDIQSGTLYVEAKTKEVSGTTTSYVHRLHALDVATGLDKHSPVIITASVRGSGDGHDASGNVPFNPLRQMNRAGLLLLNGVVYIGFASHGDNGPYHGWVIGYNAQTLARTAVFNTTPNGGLGGIWMAGGGLASDPNGNIYFMTGNGTFSASSGGSDYGDSFLKLSSASGLAAQDYFAPFDQDDLNRTDADLGSGGVLILPDQPGAHPHVILGAGKRGKIYLLNRDAMGHFQAGSDSQILQSFVGIGGSFDTPAYFNGLVYYLAVNDVLKAFRLSNGLLLITPASKATTTFGFTGATPSISANGTQNGIVWVLQNDAFGSGGPAILHAHDAANVARELYNSSQAASSRDAAGPAVKFTVPTVAGGKVFVGGQSRLTVFGYLSAVAAPTITPSGGFYNDSVSVTLATATIGAQIHYTLDGSDPTLASTLYQSPFTLQGNITVAARGFKPGLNPSPGTSAGFTLNLPPAVKIKSPGAGAVFTAPASITITTDATDGDDGLKKVEFFQGIEKLGEATAQPFEFPWDSVGEGFYTLSAKATDTLGLTATSDPVTIRVLPPAVKFIRGDANLDRRVDIGDAISIFGFLFQGGAARCEDADDVNNDGVVDISDAVALLDFLFRGGRPPPAPFPTPGVDPSTPADGLKCLQGE